MQITKRYGTNLCAPTRMGRLQRFLWSEHAQLSGVSAGPSRGSKFSVSFSRLWFGAFWQGRPSRWIGPERCHLLGATASEPVVVTALPLRSTGMGLEVSDVRKATNNAPVTKSRATPLAALYL